MRRNLIEQPFDSWVHLKLNQENGQLENIKKLNEKNSNIIFLMRIEYIYKIYDVYNVVDDEI